MKIPLVIIILVVMWPRPLSAQTPESEPSSVDLDSAAIGHVGVDGQSEEKLFDQSVTETGESGEMDRLLHVREHPFDLNTVSQTELETVPGMTSMEASEVILFRKVKRNFSSINDLALIQRNGDEILEKLRPYVRVSVGKPKGARDCILFVRSRQASSLRRLSDQTSGVSSGSQLKSYNRISLHWPDHVQVNGLFEKDEGESYHDGFVSGSAVVRELLFLSQLIVGDYTVDAGQGIVLWRGSSFGKSGNFVTLVKKSGLSAQPHRSSDEFNFLRGLAVTRCFRLGNHQMNCTAFVSHRSLSGTTDTLDVVSSFYEESLFRTEAELTKRGAVHERLIGTRVQFVSATGWDLGVTYVHTMYDKDLNLPGYFGLRGSAVQVAGVDAAVTIGHANLFGEAATLRNGASAAIAGAILGLTPDLVTALVLRDYSPGFNNPHARGFGEQEDTRNEKGVYFGAQANVGKWLALSGHIDHFRFPWRTMLDPFPKIGRDITIHAEARFSPRCEVVLRFANRMTEVTEGSQDGFGRDIRSVAGRNQSGVRLTAAHQVSRCCRLKGRVELVEVKRPHSDGSERGYLFYFGFQYSKRLFSAEARLTFFDARSYDSRLYEYENDVLGAFSNPVLFGKGRRWYVLFRYSFGSRTHFSAKYSETQAERVRDLNPWSMEIQRGTDSRISVQVDVQV